MTAKTVPPALPKSWMASTLGCVRAATALASRSKRARRSGSLATPAGSTLIATRRSSRVSLASYTSPMPPAPSRETTS